MKFTIDRLKFLKTLSIVNIAIMPKSPTPAYLNFLLEMKEDCLVVTGSNGELTITSACPIKKDDKFSIYVTSLALGVSIPVRMHYEVGVSLTNIDDGSWKDLYQEYGEIACIKAYTLKDDTAIVGNKNITVDYGGGKYFSVKVTAADGHAVVGSSVNFTINGKTITALTDDGIAKFEINVVPGIYPVTTTYKNQ